MIRIANGQGFWGDWLEAPVRLVEQGPIDYLALDYLAEVTMSILQKQRQADPALGYARDFPPLVARISGAIRERGVRVVANAGGVNPVACAREVVRLAPGLKVAVVLGDDVFPRLDEFLAKGYQLRDMDTGEPIAAIRDRIQSANAYIGAFPLAEALGTGAHVVVAGRSTDTALALAPMVHRFGWKPGEFDKLAAGTIAGHIIECGAQSTGGNCQVDWQTIPDMANIGYPIVEAEPDGTFVVTKHAAAGGRVSVHSVKEQLLYELGDPRQYITPDCVADFTSIRLEDAGPGRVRVSGIRGGPRPPTLKLSISYANGWKAIGTLVYSWPQALEKARAADRIVRERLRDLGLEFDEIYTEYFGVNACLGPAAPPNPDPPEVQLRIGVRGADKKAADRFTRELIPLVLNGPPGATGFGEGRPVVREIVAYWSALVPREEIVTRVEVVE
ncbi:MAG: acyclic terpene utilization AtuA family protein [Bryobacteraceae bacterium]